MITKKSIDEKANRAWSVYTEPAIEPITIDELKLFARIDGTDEDTLLEGFIKAARESAEKYLGRALIEQTIKMNLDYWPTVDIELPRPPLISITSVVTVDEDDSETTYSSANYYAITDGMFGKLVLKQGVEAPINTDRDYGGYRIYYKCGYGSSRSDIPQTIREGIKLWATSIYENRVVENEPPPEARSLLDLYRVIKI